jgi:hypothetical protein
MKNKKKELDVDFIGDQNHKLTAEDEKRISEAIAAYKKKNAKKSFSKRKQAA